MKNNPSARFTSFCKQAATLLTHPNVGFISSRSHHVSLQCHKDWPQSPCVQCIKFMIDTPKGKDLDKQLEAVLVCVVLVCTCMVPHPAGLKVSWIISSVTSVEGDSFDTVPDGRCQTTRLDKHCQTKPTGTARAGWDVTSFQKN